MKFLIKVIAKTSNRIAGINGKIDHKLNVRELLANKLEFEQPEHLQGAIRCTSLCLHRPATYVLTMA